MGSGEPTLLNRRSHNGRTALAQRVDVRRGEVQSTHILVERQSLPLLGKLALR